MRPNRRFSCRTISRGFVEGEVLATSEPISFLGGVDPETGIIVERGHEIEGKSIKDKILVFPYGKGSTVGAYVIYSAKKKGNAPKAMINRVAEPIIAVGAIISGIPMVQTDVELKTGIDIRVDATSGFIELL